MSDSRTQIFTRLQSLQGELDRPVADIRPEFVAGTDSLAQLFRQKLEAVQASVDIVDSEPQIVQSVANFLSTQQLPLQIALTPGIDRSVFEDLESLALDSSEKLSEQNTILINAPLGIAETGSLVLPSSYERPTLANFLPDNCIALLKESDIVPYMEDALLSIQGDDAGMPRALNLISGPSKTADIEQTLVYGAHGPIRLHVIIIS